jgi:predicted ArsR family transcriptional regulator
VAERLEILKTLGDNTRYAIYLELARSVRPLATAEVADTLGLHPNTVRPHLERMRDLGLLDVTTVATGSVGRPQHRYALAPDAPSLGLEPPAFPTLTRMLLQAAASAGLDPEDLADAGREQGRADHQRVASVGDPAPGTDVVDALEEELAAFGFDPARVDDGTSVTIAFTHCPFRQLAEDHPELVCSMHRGMVEGFVDCGGGASVSRFHPLVDRTPCQVDLVRQAG